ncbi:MAG TPA: hypothetical protein VLV88_09725 [Terriglobales bacterium]|nr:hypothetical protein [Terriglobales bacterium]
MDLQAQFESAHREHQEILEFLDRWEEALRLLESENCDVCHAGLARLRHMAEPIGNICEHCRREEEDPESPLFRFAQEADRGRMKDEHFRLYRANSEFRRELDLTKPAYTGDLVLSGLKLLTTLRGHIVYEEGLLHRFAANQFENELAASHA